MRSRRPSHPRLALCAIASIAAVAAACTADEPSSEAWISPLDGQTGWAIDAPLVAVADNLDIPPDYPLPELIRVSRFDTGSFLSGRTELLDGSIRFTPDEPWPEDTRLAWIVDVPAPVPHGPSLTFPDALREGAVFSTAATLDVLGGTLQAAPDGTELCVVLSRKTEPSDEIVWTLEINGEATQTVGTLADPAVWASDLTFPEGDPGVDVLCFDVSTADPNDPLAQPGDRVRLFLGDASWTLDDIGTDGITAIVSALRQTGGEE